MNSAQTFAISAAGMTIERTRVEVAALNLANAHTIEGADGRVYQPSRVIARSIGNPPAVSWATSFSDLVDAAASMQIGAVIPTIAIEPAGSAARMVYEPGHPLANAQGFVAYAGVDTATEMVTLMSAMRAYEANVAALNTGRTLDLKTLEIGAGNP